MVEESRAMDEVARAEQHGSPAAIPSAPVDPRAGVSADNDPHPPVPHVRTYVEQVMERVLRSAPGRS